MMCRSASSVSSWVAWERKDFGEGDRVATTKSDRWLLLLVKDTFNAFYLISMVLELPTAREICKYPRLWPPCLAVSMLACRSQWLQLRVSRYGWRKEIPWFDLFSLDTNLYVSIYQKTYRHQPYQACQGIPFQANLNSTTPMLSIATIRRLNFNPPTPLPPPTSPPSLPGSSLSERPVQQVAPCPHLQAGPSMLVALVPATYQPNPNSL